MARTGYNCYQFAMNPTAVANFLVLQQVSELPLLDRTITWSDVNSGTTNLDGVKIVGQLLADAFRLFPSIAYG